MKLKNALRASAAALALAAPVSQAALVTFEADIRNVVGDSKLLENLGIVSGESLRARFTIETDRSIGAVETNDDFAGQFFTTKTPFTSFILTSPNRIIAATAGAPDGVSTVDGVTQTSIELQDEFGILGRVLSPNGADGDMSIRLTDNDESKWSRTTPLTAAILNGFSTDIGFFLSQALDGEQPFYSVQSSEMSFREVSPVPLPAAGWLLLSGLGGLGLLRRRRAN